MLTTVFFMMANATSSDTLSSSEFPRYVSMAWLNVSNAPEITCMGGTVAVQEESKTAKEAEVPTMGPFHIFSS